MKTKLVSVIIPSYGRSHRIEKCIESILQQTYKHIEIIVVDDNPTFSDNRNKTLEKLKKYKNIKILLMDKNSGACLARNKGILESTGEYITFLDDDDIYYPTKIEKQVNVLDSNLEIDFVSCNAKVFLENKNKYIKDKKCIIGDFSKFAIDGVLHTPMLMIRKNKILDVGLFTNTSKFQDHLLTLKLLAKEMRYEIVDEELFEHIVHLEERITYSDKLEEALKNLEVIENENLNKFSKLQKNCLILRRLSLKLNAKQSLKKRNYKNELYILAIYILQLIKGFRKKELFEVFKISLRFLISPNSSIYLKLKESCR